MDACEGREAPEISSQARRAPMIRDLNEFSLSALNLELGNSHDMLC